MLGYWYRTCMGSDPTVLELMGTKPGLQCRKLVLNFGSVEGMERI